MPKRLLIKDFIKEQVIKIVDEFNKKQWASDEIFYTIKFRGAYLYCDIADESGTSKDVSLRIFR